MDSENSIPEGALCFLEEEGLTVDEAKELVDLRKYDLQTPDELSSMERSRLGELLGKIEPKSRKLFLGVERLD